ncbi:MAG: ATP-binding protein [Candidatus Moranbacteria bacterium]|jgi:hypothetical protein|nr:ATP-binding protein [Candidatus Moranbacteria bacterium]
MLINRAIQNNIENALFKGKIIIIYGPRQIGKTTLVKQITEKYLENSAYFNCDEPDIRESLTNKTSTELNDFLNLKQTQLIVLDEAQRVRNIGITLKLIADNFPETQIIATGSSSFDLANEISEPLTGRKNEFHLHAFSLEELKQIYSEIEIDRLLENRMVFGMYPEIILKKDDLEKSLKSLARSYLYKDVLQYQNIKNPEILEKLLQALALQVGSEVSYNELAGTIGVDKNTVANYIQILEKAFVIFRLNPFSRNLRSEIKKLRKIYFYDNGIRNALINNLNPLNLRQDNGALWENFMLSERVKYSNNHSLDKNLYFWRTRQKQEIDFLEEENGVLSAFEFKWKKDKFSVPKAFSDAYPDVKVALVNRKNYKKFVM